MSRGIPAPAKTIVVFALVLALALGWSTVADAQTPADVQYGSPTATSNEYSGASFTNVTNSDDSADSGTSASGSGDVGTNASGSGDVGDSEVLPSTGGPSLLLLAGSVALVASGLIVRRRRAAGR